MLSVALAVYNEEKSLGRCLESVQDFADEIVIVDGGSTDRTLEIAKKYKARIIQTDNPPIFHINKQKALEAAKGDWILALDADECVSKALRADIEAVVHGAYKGVQDQHKQSLFSRHQSIIEHRDGEVGKSLDEVVAYFIPRLNFFLGGWLRHGGVYPDGVIRLVRKGKAKWPAKSVHEQMKVEGRVGWLEHDLLHYADPTFSRYLLRAKRYTSLTAEAMKRDQVGRSLFQILHYMVLKPMAIFISLYFRHKGILDGFPGLIWAFFSALHYPIAYMKYWETHA
jgi:glycosyltransferase involved in cell wall biosynthesis